MCIRDRFSSFAAPKMAFAQTSIETLEQACKSGDYESCNSAGVDFAAGEGVEKDLVKAREFYQLSCEGEDMIGCYNLGYVFLEGQGGEKKLEESARLFRKVCGDTEQDGDGCYLLGWQLDQGLGVEKDLKAARAY